IAKDPTPLEGMCTQIEDFAVTEEVSIVSMDIKAVMKNENCIALDMRATFDCVKTDDGYKIAALHVSVPTGLQEEGEYFPVSFGEKKLDDIRNEAMLKSIVISGCEDIIKLDVLNNTYTVFSSSGSGADVFPPEGTNYKTALLDYTDANVVKEDIITVKKELSPENIASRLAHESVFRIYYKTSTPGKVRNKKVEVFYIDKWKRQAAIVRTDVTESVVHEQRRNEMLAAALRSAEKANNAKLDFLSRMSHEVRTPLNSIIGMCEIASNSAGDAAAVIDCVSKIDVSSKYLLSLVNDIMDMSKTDGNKFSLRREPFNLSALIGSVNNIICAQAEAKGVSYNCSVSKLENEDFKGDFVKLQQVLLNILGNAVKFTPREGRVDFAVSEI
ncbi:MAG: histidine kinase dimerization/phospho-acceptor domain-containing protein, partial [Synergistaceae bacterium]